MIWHMIKAVNQHQDAKRRGLLPGFSEGRDDTIETLIPLEASKGSFNAH